MKVVLIVTAIIFANDPQKGPEGVVDLARMIHEMDFPSMQECEAASQKYSVNIEKHLEESIRHFWAPQFPNVSFYVESGSACSF